MAKQKPVANNNMMKQVQKMQEDMLAAQEALAALEVEGSAGGGMVKAVMTGGGELRSVSISADVVDPDDIEMLEDLVVAAVSEAMRASAALQSEQMAGVDRRPGPQRVRSGLSRVLASLYEGPVQRLIDELGRLPGIGPKSAQRISYYLLKIAPEDARRLAGAIIEVKEKISWCRRCFNIAEGELCSYCLDHAARRHVALCRRRAA